MAKYVVGYNGKWRERFSDRDEAIERAREVSESGWTVEVISRRFGFPRFVTGFPDSERESLQARWTNPGFLGAVFGSNGSGGAHSQHGSAFGGGGHVGGGGGGHGGH